MEDIKAKQQVIEKIKEASKILVTVSNNPSVDALSAALGLTLLFDKQEKYATAIFSGEVPPAIAFLEPEKTFDETTDSLRDFIIALNKEKADHLRYKVEGDSVKIFITPYKTTISDKDLEFSQGDYNVELVIALGVDSQDHLDKAMDDHGQILHDATVITVSAGDQSSNLGGIDWHDANASSLSEMVTGLAEALKEDKKKPLLDGTIATALLTGIVAETERFSNEHTTSKAMTVAAQLMTAGADQQLIATELQAGKVAEEPEQESTNDDTAEETNEVESEEETVEVIPARKDELVIDHEEQEEAEPVETESQETPESQEDQPEETHEETLAELDARMRNKNLVEEAKRAADAPRELITPSEFVAPVVPEPTSQPEQLAPEVKKSEDVTSNYSLDIEDSPALGGTLNATSEQAAEDSRREAMSGQNKTILSHAYGGDDTQVSNTMGSELVGFPGTPDVAPGSVGINEVPDGEVHSAYSLAGTGAQAETSAENSAPTFGAGGEKTIEPMQHFAAPQAPVDLGLPLPPPLPDFSQTAMPPAFPQMATPGLPEVQPFEITPQPTTQTEILGDILAPEPTDAYSYEETPLPKPTQPDNPGQFKIPS